MKTTILLLLLLFSRFSCAYSQVTWNTFTTDYGSIQLGPANNSFGHIYTDRPSFMFNKDINNLTGGYGAYSGANLSLKTNYITRLTILNNGNIGIGTLAPIKKFHVVGDSKFNGELTIEHNSLVDWAYCLSLSVNRDKTKAFTVNSSSGNNLFTIWGNGVVNAKTVYAEEIEVRIDALGIYWPDYVFKENFKLRPLIEVEDYFNEYSHLPDVPSEDEILCNGLNLAEMDAILLKKIEELTLYIIEQQKEIEKLKLLNIKDN